jgi:hypothetical protein
MGGACSMYGGEEKRLQSFGENLKERGLLENKGVDGRIILNGAFRNMTHQLD